MMSRHGLTGGARGLVYRGEPRQTIFLIYQGRRGSRCAWRRWEVMDGLVAVMRWLFDGKHPHMRKLKYATRKSWTVVIMMARVI